jgi:hypothetical protein
MSLLFYAFKSWPIVRGQTVNPPLNLETYVYFKKLEQVMHGALIHIQYTNACAIYKEK